MERRLGGALICSSCSATSARFYRRTCPLIAHDVDGDSSGDSEGKAASGTAESDGRRTGVDSGDSAGDGGSDGGPTSRGGVRESGGPVFTSAPNDAETCGADIGNGAFWSGGGGGEAGGDGCCAALELDAELRRRRDRRVPAPPPLAWACLPLSDAGMELRRVEGLRGKPVGSVRSRAAPRLPSPLPRRRKSPPARNTSHRWRASQAANAGTPWRSRASKAAVTSAPCWFWPASDAPKRENASGDRGPPGGARASSSLRRSRTTLAPRGLLFDADGGSGGKSRPKSAT